MTRQQQKRNKLYRQFRQMPRRTVSDTYSIHRCRLIAKALKVKTRQVWAHRNELEESARSYRAHVRGPLRTPPSKRLERLNRAIECSDALLRVLTASAPPNHKRFVRHRRSLLRALYVEVNIKSDTVEVNDAPDGVGNGLAGRELFEALAAASESDGESAVTNSIRTIGGALNVRLMIGCVRDLRDRANQAHAYIIESEVKRCRPGR